MGCACGDDRERWSHPIIHRQHLCHEVTSPRPLLALGHVGWRLFRPKQTTLTADHNIPTMWQNKPIRWFLVPVFRGKHWLKMHRILDWLYYGLNNPKNGIVHVIGPEMVIPSPVMSIVCGDSHTSTHGAFWCHCLWYRYQWGGNGCGVSVYPADTPQNHADQILKESWVKNVSAKDMALYMISQLTTGALPAILGICRWKRYAISLWKSGWPLCTSVLKWVHVED